MEQYQESEILSQEDRKKKYKDPLLTLREYQKALKQQVADTDSSSINIEPILNELGIEYDKNNHDDYYELAKLLCKGAQYPSSQMAELHGKVSKLGIINSKRKCPCCGQSEAIDMSLQFESLSLQQRQFHDVYQMYKFFIYLFLQMFLIYGVYSLVSNIITSNTYKNDTNKALTDKSMQSYEIPLLFSFGSQQFHPTAFAAIAVFVQGFLSIIALLRWGWKLNSKEAVIRLLWKSQKEEVQSRFGTILCRNIPYQKYDVSLIKKLQRLIKTKIQSYMKHIGHETNIQQKDIMINTVDYAMPMHVNVNVLENFKKYEQRTDQQAEEKQKLKKLLRQRTQSLNFKTGQAERKKLYQNCLEASEKRFQAYQDLGQEYKNAVDKSLVEQQNPKRVSIFVTFFDKNLHYLILMAEENTPKSFRQSFDQFFQKQISWAHASAPNEIIWENFNLSFREKAFRFLITLSVTVTVLSSSFLILYNLSRFKLYADANITQSKDSSILSSLASIVISIPIYTINFIIKILFDYLSRKWEKNTTLTDMQVSLASKTILVMFMNSVMIPIFVNMAYKENIYGVDGLASEVFYFALTNAILMPMMKLFNISFILNRLQAWYSNLNCNKWKTNQFELNKKNQYLMLQSELEYASVNFIFLYTCFFAPLQPIIILFTGLGLFFSRYAFKVVVVKMAKRPILCSSQVDLKMFRISYIGPVLFAIGTFFWTDIYAISVPHYRILNFMLLALSIIIILFRNNKWSQESALEGINKNSVITLFTIQSPVEILNKILENKVKPNYYTAYDDKYFRVNPYNRLKIPSHFRFYHEYYNAFRDQQYKYRQNFGSLIRVPGVQYSNMIQSSYGSDNWDYNSDDFSDLEF